MELSEVITITMQNLNEGSKVKCNYCGQLIVDTKSARRRHLKKCGMNPSLLLREGASCLPTPIATSQANALPSRSGDLKSPPKKQSTSCVSNAVGQVSRSPSCLLQEGLSEQQIEELVYQQPITAEGASCLPTPIATSQANALPSRSGDLKSPPKKQSTSCVSNAVGQVSRSPSCLLQEGLSEQQIEELANQQPITALLQNVKLQFSDSFKTQPVGLRNRSNWCYVNASLQCLESIAPLWNFLLHLSTEGSLYAALLGEEVPAVKAIVDLTQQMCNRNEGYADPAPFLDMLLSTASSSINVVEGRQEDAEEFIIWLLNRLSEEMRQVLKPAHLNELAGH